VPEAADDQFRLLLETAELAPSETVQVGSGKNLGRYAASWIACWPKRPSSIAVLT
jgi:hypothetical protein